MQTQWNDHTLEVTGDWTGRWLFLAPEYTLTIDGELLDRLGGPRVHPRLEGQLEYDDGSNHHVEARILSVLGVRPRCELLVDGQPVAEQRVPVANVLNPVLMLVILISAMAMLYVGPDVMRYYLPFV